MSRHVGRVIQIWQSFFKPGLLVLALACAGSTADLTFADSPAREPKPFPDETRDGAYVKSHFPDLYNVFTANGTKEAAGKRIFNGWGEQQVVFFLSSLEEQLKNLKAEELSDAQRNRSIRELQAQLTTQMGQIIGGSRLRQLYDVKADRSSELKYMNAFELNKFAGPAEWHTGLQGIIYKVDGDRLVIIRILDSRFGRESGPNANKLFDKLEFLNESGIVVGSKVFSKIFYSINGVEHPISSITPGEIPKLSFVALPKKLGEEETTPSGPEGSNENPHRIPILADVIQKNIGDYLKILYDTHSKADIEAKIKKVRDGLSKKANQALEEISVGVEKPALRDETVTVPKAANIVTKGEGEEKAPYIRRSKEENLKIIVEFIKTNRRTPQAGNSVEERRLYGRFREHGGLEAVKEYLSPDLYEEVSGEKAKNAELKILFDWMRKFQEFPYYKAERAGEEQAFKIFKKYAPTAPTHETLYAMAPEDVQAIPKVRAYGDTARFVAEFKGRKDLDPEMQKLLTWARIKTEFGAYTSEWIRTKGNGHWPKAVGTSDPEEITLGRAVGQNGNQPKVYETLDPDVKEMPWIKYGGDPLRTYIDWTTTNLMIPNLKTHDEFERRLAQWFSYQLRTSKGEIEKEIPRRVADVRELELQRKVFVKDNLAPWLAHHPYPIRKADSTPEETSMALKARRYGPARALFRMLPEEFLSDNNLRLRMDPKGIVDELRDKTNLTKFEQNLLYQAWYQHDTLEFLNFWIATYKRWPSSSGSELYEGKLQEWVANQGGQPEIFPKLAATNKELPEILLFRGSQESWPLYYEKVLQNKSLLNSRSKDPLEVSLANWAMNRMKNHQNIYNNAPDYIQAMPELEHQFNPLAFVARMKKRESLSTIERKWLFTARMQVEPEKLVEEYLRANSKFPRNNGNELTEALYMYQWVEEQGGRAAVLKQMPADLQENLLLKAEADPSSIQTELKSKTDPLSTDEQATLDNLRMNTEPFKVLDEWIIAHKATPKRTAEEGSLERRLAHFSNNQKDAVGVAKKLSAEARQYLPEKTKLKLREIFPNEFNPEALVTELKVKNRNEQENILFYKTLMSLNPIRAIDEFVLQYDRFPYIKSDLIYERNLYRWATEDGPGKDAVLAQLSSAARVHLELQNPTGPQKILKLGLKSKTEKDCKGQVADVYKNASTPAEREVTK